MESKDINSRVNTWDLTDTISFGLGIFLIAVGIVSFFICRYGYFGDSIPITPTGYSCFLFFSIPGIILVLIPLNWNLRATAAVASAGIILNVWVADYSTKQIRSELKRTTKEATTEIKKALYPNKFMFRIVDKWYEPGEQPQPIELKDREFTLCLAVWNKAKYSARDVFVQLYFMKEEFEDDHGKFIEKLSKVSNKEQVSFYPGWQDWSDPRFKDLKESFAFSIRLVPRRQKLALPPITTKLKSNKAKLVVRINNILFYNFEFKVEK